MVIALLLFIILFPFIFVPGYINYTIYKFIFLSLFCIGSWIYYLFKTKNISIKMNNYTEDFLTFFLFQIILSTIFSIDFNQSLIGSDLRHEGFPVLISYASLFFFFSYYLKPNKVKYFLETMVVIALVASIFGIYQYYQLDPIKRIFYQTDWTRSFSFFGNPNFFGSFITLMLPLSIVLYLLTSNEYKKTFYFLTTGVLFLSLILSQTRSGWIGSLVTYVLILFFIVLKRKALWKRFYFITIMFLTIVLIINYHPEAQKVVTRRIEQTIDELKGDTDRVGSGRLFIWRKALPLFNDYWLYGSGPDTFELVFPNDSDEVDDFFGGEYADKAHNDYLHYGITLGVPALILYLLFLFSIIVRGVRTSKYQRTEYQILQLSLISAIIGYMIQAFFNISVVVVAPYFWIILGLSYALSKNKEKKIDNETFML